MLVDVGVSGDNLVLGGQLGALLEFEVSNGARQSQVAVDAAKVDETTGGSNAVLLLYRSQVKLCQYKGLFKKSQSD